MGFLVQGLLFISVKKQRGCRTMKTAFAHWDNRIAPVFDIARRIRIVESDEGRIIGESEETLEDGSAVRRVIDLAQLNIATLVCGAISRQLQEMVMSNGIQVIPFIAGDLGEITRAWLDGTLEHERFAMPGCCRRGRTYRRRRCCDGERRQP
jgi:predicted Fe-Mo cluster-binding NifX family protein